MSYEEPGGLTVETTVDAPRPAVFETVAAFDRWPELISVITGGGVTSETTTGEGVEMEWEVTVAGITVPVRETITDYEPPRAFGWESLPDSRWRHEGGVEFEAADDETTAVRAVMHYDVPWPADNRITRRLFTRRFQREMERSFDRVARRLEAEE